MKNNRRNKRGGNPKKIGDLLQDAIQELKPLPKGWVYLFIYIDGDPDSTRAICLN